MSRALVRSAAILAALVVIGCQSGRWQAAVDDANEQRQPLVIEFYAAWCKPCKWFERAVLPQPEVQRELSRVTFRRLDFDSPEGQQHARRLGVRGVPTFVAVDERGEVVGGLRGAAGAERFLEFLRWSQAQKQARQAASPAP